MKKISFLMLFFLFVMFVMDSSKIAAEPADRILVTILAASNQGHDFNLDNDEYKDELIRLFSYTYYKQIDQSWVELEKSVRKKVDLPEGYELSLTLQDRTQERLEIQAVIKKGKIVYMDSILAVRKPGMIFLGGPQFDGEVLILGLEYRQ